MNIDNKKEAVERDLKRLRELEKEMAFPRNSQTWNIADQVMILRRKLGHRAPPSRFH